jgi:hypothetical protein
MTFGRVTYEFQFQQFKPFKPSESDGEISPQRARERGVGQDNIALRTCLPLSSDLWQSTR